MRKLLILFFLFSAVFPAFGKDYLVQALENAHASFRSATNSAMYVEAAQQYESLIHEEGIRNGHLFYTTGNSWFMAGDVGRAILNYRRAELFIPNDADLKHNLEAASGLKADLIPKKEPHPLAARLLGWHFGTSTQARWMLFSATWIACWGLLYWTLRSSRKEAKVGGAVTGILALSLLLSLISESIIHQRADPGVITSNEVVARKGDGPMYAPAFLDPLHSGTEFQSLETRGKWRHIRLVDGQTCWIPTSAGEAVAIK